MRFFTPNQKFFDWIIKLSTTPKRLVIECGCGEGDTLREMRQKGVPAIGVDPCYAIFDMSPPDDLPGAILAMEAQDCPIVKNSPAIILVCRPCHSGFPQQIYEEMHKESVLYYIGLERNIESDLGELTYTKVFEDVVGDEGEYLWKVG